MPLSGDRDTLRKIVGFRSFPLAAGVTIFEGALVALDASGYARPARSGTLTDKIVGRATSRANNAAGAAGDISVNVQSNESCAYANSGGGDIVALTDIGADVYAVDDFTLAKTNGGGTRVRAGKVHDVGPEGVWIQFDS
jgi:hypothetical protein